MILPLLQESVHSFIERKLLEFPLQPPYENGTHFPFGESKAHRTKLAKHGPVSGGCLQSAAMTCR